MGLGLYITSPIPKKGILRRKQNAAELFTDISNALLAFLPDELQRCVFGTQSQDNVLSVQLHPAEEPVEFKVEDEQVICSAKTNSAGPGYHAFLVDSLDSLAGTLDLKWKWSDESGDIGDETGYYASKDFRLLQDEMLKWLRSVSKHLVDTSRDEMDSLMISMPLNYGLVCSESFAVSPMGFWDREWFRQVAECEVANLKNQGSQFFPWWEQGFGSDFWYKCGITKAWIDLTWHSPANTEERDDFQFVLDCFKKSQSIQKDITLPEKEIEQIRQCLAENDCSPVFEPSGIGFKKRIMSRSLTGYWTAKIPGYYYSELEQNQETAVYWFRDRTIRGSSISVTRKDGRCASPEEMLDQKSATTDIIDVSKGHLKGFAQIKREKEDGKEYWNLDGRMAAANGLCIVTICFDRDEDRDWAIETWKSINIPPLEQDTEGSSAS